MNELEKFKKSIELFIDGCNSIEVRAACFFAYSKWVNLGTRIILSEKLPKDIVPSNVLPEFHRFKAFHEVHAISILNEILAQIEKGILTVSGNNIYFKIENNEVKVVPPYFSFQRNYRFDRFVPRDFSFPSIILRGGESLHTLLYNHSESIGQEYLDSGLRSYKVPYNGLNDLLVNFVGVSKPDFGHIESAIVEVIAPIQLRLGNDCKLSNGKLTIHVEVVGYDDLKGISIGLIKHSGTISQCRTSLVLERTDWKKENGRLIYVKEVDADNATSVDIFLSFKGELLDMLRVRDPSTILKNPRIKVYDHFDKDLKVLNEYLESQASEEFEKGIALLLHFCGFNVGSYGLIKGKRGRSGIQEEIDLIAFAPDEYVIAVECTIRDINVNEKISKFSRRIKEVRELLAPLGDYIIVPLIFTTLERNKISKSDLEKAGKEGVGVVAIENIRELLEMAGQQKGLEEILIYLDSFVAESLSYNE